MKIFRRSLLAATCLFVLTGGCMAQTQFQSLNFLYEIQGKQVVAGQHNDQKDLECGFEGATGATYWSDQVLEITGKRPGLYSGDFLFHGQDSLRWEVTYEAERQWKQGALVNLMWHACPPDQGETCQWQGGLLSALNQQQWQELLEDGTTLNKQWKSQVDRVAVHLQYLNNAGVEVFWRPYHEQNQQLFWWNSQGPENTKALWRLFHDYLTKEHGLDNLIWVWDVQDIAGERHYSAWNPGDKYWDVMALDIYDDAYTNDRYYDQMVEVAGEKPIVIGECFQLPTEAYLKSHPKFSFFMTWAYGLKYGLSCEETNTASQMREVYENPRVLTLEDMSGWK